MKEGMSFCPSVRPIVGRSAKFETSIFFLFLHHLKALNERISEWAYFLNLTKRFRRYLNFSAPKKGVFSDET